MYLPSLRGKNPEFKPSLWRFLTLSLLHLAVALADGGVSRLEVGADLKAGSAPYCLNCSGLPPQIFFWMAEEQGAGD